jgi:hypothetical protein
MVFIFLLLLAYFAGVEMPTWAWVILWVIAILSSLKITLTCTKRKE